MAISVTCESCKRTFQVEDELQGEDVKCPTCHEEVVAEGSRVRDHDVFISHAHEDVQVAFAICAKLENKGIRCWMAPRNVPSGETWGASIIEAIGDSVAMIVVFSSLSNESKQVLREIERAVSKKLEVVALRIDDAALTQDLEYFLSASLWLDATNETMDSVLDQLTYHVTKIVGKDTPAGNNASRSPKTGHRIRPQPDKRNVLFRAAAVFALAIVAATAGGLLVWQLQSYLPEMGAILARADTDPGEATGEDPAPSSASGSESDLDAEAESNVPPDEAKDEGEPDDAAAISNLSALNLTTSAEESEEEDQAAPDNTAADSWDEGRSEATLRLGPHTTMEFVWINPGRFNMGSPASEQGRDDNETFHPVRLTSGFWMAKHEVTQEQWSAVMGSDNNPSTFGGSTHPVDGVSWVACFKFFSKLKSLTGHNFRLPTEAEWEYACRTKTNDAARFRGKELDDYAWYRSTSNAESHPVGQLLPNAWGLFDMQGNVAELCADRLGPYPKGSVTDPTGPEQRANVVIRGGSWASDAIDLRPAKRNSVKPQASRSAIGFRICRSQ